MSCELFDDMTIYLWVMYVLLHDWGYVCDCYQGYAEQRCQTSINLCSPYPVLGHINFFLLIVGDFSETAFSSASLSLNVINAKSLRFPKKNYFYLELSFVKQTITIFLDRNFNNHAKTGEMFVKIIFSNIFRYTTNK